MMIAGARNRRGCKVAYDKFHLKEIENTCYDETSRYYIESSRDMESLHSVATSSVDYTSGGVPALAVIGLPLAHKVQGLLVDVERLAPNARIKSRAAECLTELKEFTEGFKQDQVDKLYEKHVLSKIGSCDYHDVSWTSTITE